MEESRLKPMASYDAEMFGRLYKQVNGLKRKLASEISPGRFGVEYQDILSWFDVKLLFVFHKYQKDPENIILAKIINSLKVYKCKILRRAYKVEFSQTIIPMDSVEYEIASEESTLKDHYSNVLSEFMQKHLSPDAFCLHDLVMHPTPYVLRRLNELEVENQNKIPMEIFLEYFDLPESPNSVRFIESLQSEIKEAIKMAKLHFRSN